MRKTTGGSSRGRGKGKAARRRGPRARGAAPAARFLTGVLAALMVFSPGLLQGVLAQAAEKTPPTATASAAPAHQVEILRRLARAGYLGDRKDLYLSTRALSPDDVTDALLAIDESLSRVDPQGLKPGGPYRVPDLKALLSLVHAKSDDILARKVSAWRFEHRLKKMIAALAAAAPAPSPEPTTTPAPQPTDTPAPPPGPTRAEWNDLKASLADLQKKTGDLQASYDRKLADLEASNDSLKASDSDTQAQLKLVKNLLDRVQDDLKNTQDRLDDVARKAAQKNIDETERRQQMEILQKDVRDNTQDVSVLKEQVAAMDKTDNNGTSPLDQFLGSKYLAGGALLVGLAALVVSFTRK